MPLLVIHGHFYQPPRENPWIGAIDPEPSALPFHDWNERIQAECYQPNSAVRIFDPKTQQELIVNNYEKISFDFGPTLLSWLEGKHPETYARILAADATSTAMHHGHGNALAQAYNHIILPLANERDQRTQIRWGLADFRHRFGREAEGMWLAETAANDDSLGLLIDEGLRFVVLAPQQAQRVRIRTTPPDLSEPPASAGGEVSKPIVDESNWQDVTGGRIDTSVAYNYFHRDGSGRSLAVFFYDQALAHGIAFEQTLASSATLADRLAGAAMREGRAGLLVNVATDGESYGHHHKFGDLCLAHAMEIDAPARGFLITNYGEYLDQHPPDAEVEIYPGSDGEGSSWSCVHGVGRWIRDCGCHTGGEPGWNQSWRLPLRQALNFLRDEVAQYFEATRGQLFIDPWIARDASIGLILDEHKSREEFLREVAPGELNSKQKLEALLFLELQRNTLLM
ncbi:MAG TPA: DUF3536 domain-containing protein, partial [Pyrinomonadaceae bacterium]|nr:DUF3536 domain-containing protein [Pyrinomonadaceae bacterium]